MRTLIVIALLLLPSLAVAATGCTTRKSGSVTITTCSNKTGFNTHCRSYMSGSTRKTSCR
jgi:hypothetical protein